MLVGIGGPGGSGKSTLARWLAEQIEGCEWLSLDDFRLPRHGRPRHAPYGSHPEGNNVAQIREALQAGRAGRPVMQPCFDREKGLAEHARSIQSFRVLLVDGELSAHAWLRDQLDHLFLVETHLLNQLRARLRRDRAQRRCSVWKALHLYRISNLRDYPRFSTGAREMAEVRIYRSWRNDFRLYR
jgi:uridine kinase